MKLDELIKQVEADKTDRLFVTDVFTEYKCTAEGGGITLHFKLKPVQSFVRFYYHLNY